MFMSILAIIFFFVVGYYLGGYTMKNKIEKEIINILDKHKK